MAADPQPFYVVLITKLVQLLPEVVVLDRLPVRRLPPALFPGMDPLADPELDILGIGMQFHPGAGLERLQRANDRQELHAVVGCQTLSAVKLLRRPPVAQDQRAPAAD